jgi:hypothetical protein
MLGLMLVSVFSEKVHIGFFGNIALLVGGTLFTTIGVVIGDAFRRFVMPDSFFSSGALDAFKKKLFWLYGPQAVGWFIGYMITGNLIAKIQ